MNAQYVDAPQNFDTVPNAVRLTCEYQPEVRFWTIELPFGHSGWPGVFGVLNENSNPDHP